VKKTEARPAFNLVALVRSTGLQPSIRRCDVGRLIFSAGDAADSIMYVVKGTVKMSVVSKLGREAVVAMVRAGDFFGEACLAGQRTRASTATAMDRSVIVVIERIDMVQLLQTQAALCDRFIEHMLFRNVRLEADLLDQLVSPCEQRLARTLLLLARYGRRCRKPRKVLPMTSQSTLAGMVGSTRSRINYFMNKFERLGFIETDGGLTVNRSLLRVTQETTHAR
jgi:CRP/FNR family transcriptional regulator, cyclic AMP receptor protein